VTESARLEVGDKAPAFSLPDADGKTVTLSDFKGRKVVVYFYPAASTPGCTKQACAFRDSLADLNNVGIDVVGISPDKPEKLAKFRDEELAHHDHAVEHGARLLGLVIQNPAGGNNAGDAANSAIRQAQTSK
jgi:peroxiredoxin